MTSITKNRFSLHKQLQNLREQNNALKSQNMQLQHLANLGTASFMIAHEINNLLTPLSTYAGLALQNPNDKDLAEKVIQKTAKNSERAAKIMESMLALANGREQEKKNAKLNLLIEEIFTCLCRDFTKDGIVVHIDVPGDLVVWCVPVQLQQVIMNLILNARDAMLPHGGILTIKATETTEQVRIEVADTGKGIEPANLTYIFDSFFTTKTDADSTTKHSGCGLGLAFCKKIIDAHNGLISVESESTKGSTFKIFLPKSRPGIN